MFIIATIHKNTDVATHMARHGHKHAIPHPVDGYRNACDHTKHILYIATYNTHVYLICMLQGLSVVLSVSCSYNFISERMAEMTKAIKLTPHDHNVHLKLSDVLSRGSIILGFPCLSDEQVRNMYD